MRNNKVYIDGLQYGLPTREYFQEALDAGLDMVHVTVVFWENASETLRVFGQWFRLFDSYADLIYPATDTEGLKACVGTEKRLAVLFGFQNCSSMENNIDFIELYRRLNVGVIQLSYNNQSPLCGGCYEKDDVGISRFGKGVIAEMNRVGMLIDMSHSSSRSTLEAIEYSQRPIVITHAQSLSFRKSIRNKPDEVLRALGASGGMLGLSLYPFHLKNTSDCTLSEMMDEIKRLVDVVGIEHLGLGTDICQGRSVDELEYMRNGHWTKVKDYGEGSAENSGWPRPASWYRRISDFALLEDAMIAHGFDEEEVEKIMGKNWHGFFKASLRAQTPTSV